METDWRVYRKHCQERFPNKVPDNADTIVFYNGIHYVPDFMQWAFENYQNNYKPDAVKCSQEAKESQIKWMEDQIYSYTYFEFKCGDRNLGRVIFELWEDKCPKTCENFRALNSGEAKDSEDRIICYQNTPIHRVVPNGWIQGGDVYGGSGDKGCSIYGQYFDDENLKLQHDVAGLIGMSEAMRPHTNNSQFYITVNPLPWLDKQRVLFGRVVEGMDIVYEIEKMECKNERPIDEVIIDKCGIMSEPGARKY